MTYTPPFNEGDTLAVIDPPKYSPLRRGDVVRVIRGDEGDGVVVLAEDPGHAWAVDRFNLLLKRAHSGRRTPAPAYERAEILDLGPIILDPDVNVFTIPRRSYDFTAGDRRFSDRQEAVEHANEEALRTGVRQVIRIDRSVEHIYGKAFHLVQAVGS